jgi:hypothetical protein
MLEKIGKASFNASGASMTDNWKDALELYEIEKKSQYEQAKFLFDQSRTYNTVIMALAYGGFFSMWSAVAGFSIDKRTVALAGALMTISIITFVSYTMLNMFLMSKISVRNAKLAELYGSPNNLDDFKAMVARMTANRETMNTEIRAKAIRVAQLWPPFFYTSVISGFAGSFILLFLLLKHHGVWLF